MWNERIIEAKKAKGMSTKTMSEKTLGHLPERTITRILSGETPNPRIDTIIELGAAVGLTPQELFSDTNAIAATETLVEVKETLAEVKENAEVVEAEKGIAIAELEMLRAKSAAQEKEIALLKEKLQHKEELLAVYNYFTKIKPSEQ